MTRVTAEHWHRAMAMTKERRSRLQGFIATAAKPVMHYIRDTALPYDEQRVWEIAEGGDTTYEVAHAAMMDEIEIRGYQIALDYLLTTPSSPNPSPP